MIELEAWLVVRALGWALVHFLWQGALVAAVLELVVFGMRRGSSELRYLVRCGALLLMAAAPALTFLVMRAAQPLAAEMLSATERVPAPAAPWLGEAWPVLVVLAWSLGAALLGARLLRDWRSVRRLAVDTPPGLPGALPPEWQARFEAMACAMGVRAVARVVASARLGAPVVIGALRPVVLLPVRVFTGLTPEQIEAVIAHELAHVRRHDYLVNLIQSAVEAALFYHPAVWWVSRGIRAEREYCCDDAAVRVSTDRVSYARALTTLESWRIARPAVGMSTLGGSLMVRIQRLIGIQHDSPRPGGALSFLGALLGASLFAAVALGNAAPAQDPEALSAMRARIEALRARIDELAELTDRLAAHAHQERAPDAAPEAHAGALHELLQGARRAEGDERAGEPDSEVHTRRLHELLLRAYGARAEGNTGEALDADRIRLHVHDALRQLGEKNAGQHAAHPQTQETLHKALQLDHEQARRLHERLKTAFERTAQAREHSAEAYQHLHERALKALASGNVRRLQGVDPERLHEALRRAAESGALLRLEGMDVEELHEHLKQLQESGVLQRLRLLEKAGRHDDVHEVPERERSEAKSV